MTSNIRIGVVIIFLFTIFLSFPLPTTATSGIPIPTVNCQAEPLKCGSDNDGKVTTPLANPNDSFGLLGNLVSTLITIIIIAAAATAFVFFIIGAIQWGTAGSGDGAAKGRLTMIYAAVGLIAVALVYVVVILFNNVLPFAPGYDIPSNCTEGGPC